MSGNHPQTRVFVYGSLLNRARQRRVLGREVRMLPARLPGYQRGRARYFYIVARPGAETTGAILLGLDARDLAALDRYEEVPDLYTREVVTVDHRRRWPDNLLVLPADPARNRRAVKFGASHVTIDALEASTAILEGCGNRCAESRL